MNLDKFTQKAQEAVLEAQRLAGEYKHSQVESEHLLAALVRQPDGVVPQVLSRLIDVRAMAEQVEAALASRPKVYGANTQVTLSRPAADVLNNAERAPRNMKDEFVSTEHILLAMTNLLRNFPASAKLDHNAVQPASPPRTPRRRLMPWRNTAAT
jgi:ATP-dependent Clp protease ATP-binding subunit ClpB